MDTHGYYVTNGMVYDPAGRLVARIPGRVDLATSAGLDVVRELERQRAENARLRAVAQAAREFVAPPPSDAVPLEWYESRDVRALRRAVAALDTDGK